jgi:3-phenylpropionate/trans-cinnamate dioxygenase ferredoxin reductase component
MVIVGGGQAGGRAAEALRAAGWTGRIVLLADEDRAPYERPPLSKEVLTGGKEPAQCALFPPAFFAAREIELRLATPAVSLDRARRAVLLADGAAIPYHRLLLAPGAAPRRLAVPGSDRAKIHYLRTAADAARLRAALGPQTRLVIIGGGFIGLEVAASAAARGARVTVVEAGPRLAMRMVPPEIAERLAARHRAAGVELRLGSTLAAIEGPAIEGAAIDGTGRESAVLLDDGSAIACDAVLVAIGVAPRTALAHAAGLAVENGIAADETLRTSDPEILAAGDACSFPHALFAARVRFESWMNANEQAAVAARNMLGGAERYELAPWLWSDQYELTVQIAGLPSHACRTVPRPIGPEALLLFHLAANGRLVAVSAVGPNEAIARPVRLGRMLIERGLHAPEAALADPSVNLKSLLAPQAA